MKWLTKNLKSRIRRAFRKPSYTAKALIHDALGIDERYLAAVSNSTPAAIRGLLNDPSADRQLMRHWEASRTRLHSGSHPANDPYAKKVLMQYARARAVAPDVIVETGVSSGISSTYLLLACERNGKGRVHSIDINNKEFLAPGNEIGCIVPENLKQRWTLMLDDSHRVLAPLLSSLGNVDIFIHDSSHTYQDMKFEFETSYPYIRAGGLLLSDDANFNEAFAECARAFRPAASRIIRNFGIMKKQ